MSIQPHLPGTLYHPQQPRGTSGPLSPLPPRLIVLHTTRSANAPTVATAEEEATYAANRNDPRSRWTSAHFYVDDQTVLGSQSLTMRAWAALNNGNAIGWHIEMCARSTAVPDAVLVRTAELVKRLGALGGIPLVKLTPTQVRAGGTGICGHFDITLAYPEDHGDHTDPGWGTSQWDKFMALAVEGATMSYEVSDRELDWNTAWRLQEILAEHDPIVVPPHPVFPTLIPGFTEANLPLRRLKVVEGKLDALLAQAGTVALTPEQITRLAMEARAGMPTVAEIAAAVNDDAARRLDN